MAKGIVYCLTNPAMPDLVKIGRCGPISGALQRRMKDLYYSTTGVPVPFELYYAVSVDDAKKAESLLHKTFANDRVNRRREFFDTDPEYVVAAMQLTGGEDVSIDDLIVDKSDSKITQIDINARERLQQQENRRLSNFTFGEAGIMPGEELVFTRDTSITAEVHDDRKIIFEGKESSLSGAADEILERNGKRGKVAGPLYWLYQGETLAARRRRMRMEKEDELEE